MDRFLLIIGLFGGLALVFTVGWAIGTLLKLDKFYEEFQKQKEKNNPSKHETA